MGYDWLMKDIKAVIFTMLVFIVSGCANATPLMLPTSISTQEAYIVNDSVVANVLTVKTTGNSNAFQFAVEISSPDTGCDQYADWWEVLSEGGQLLYRRVLLHSHVDEQPFTRFGGVVPITTDTVVYVRAHMNTGGYGGSVLKGTVTSGFDTVALEPDFAADVETQQPLPEGCDF